MVRFFYKVDTQQKAKILRKVSPIPYYAHRTTLSQRIMLGKNMLQAGVKSLCTLGSSSCSCWLIQDKKSV